MSPRQNAPRRSESRRVPARFRLLFQDNPQPMWVFDRDTLEFLDVNKAAIARYGYSRDEFLSMRIADLRPAEDEPRAPKSVSRNQALVMWRHRVKDGRIIDVEVLVHDTIYEGRRAALAVLIDVTQRRLLEEQLRQAQKMEAVGMLAGGIAHDFNNLLTIITGYSQLILNTLSEGDANRGAVEQIMKAGERAAALTRQLLAFSRRQVLQPKVMDLNQLVAGLGVMLRRLIGEDIDLRLVMGPELGRVNADPGQMEQVIMNLAVNSRDAMPKGGALTIETMNADLDSAYVKSHIAVRPGSYVMLAVSDTGIGMDEETQAHLFEPFYTTKTEGRGTGLGLSIVFGIVKQSGGNIEVYSEPGQGTSVKIYLPRVDQAAFVEEEGFTHTAHRGTETILLVEDEDMLRRLVRETLEREGYTVLDAAGPAEAQRICHSFNGPIHLMVTDVIMPKLNGRELAERVAAVHPEMHVLYMSGYTDNAVVTNGVLQGAMPFLQKPFTPTALARKVREMLDGGNGEKTRHASS
jgi:PAS domain S-box-containing protein